MRKKVDFFFSPYPAAEEKQKEVLQKYVPENSSVITFLRGKKKAISK